MPLRPKIPRRNDLIRQAVIAACLGIGTTLLVLALFSALIFRGTINEGGALLPAAIFLGSLISALRLSRRTALGLIYLVGIITAVYTLLALLYTLMVASSLSAGGKIGQVMLFAALGGLVGGSGRFGKSNKKIRKRPR